MDRVLDRAHFRSTFAVFHFSEILTKKSSNIELSDSIFMGQVIGLNLFLELGAH